MASSAEQPMERTTSSPLRAISNLERSPNENEEQQLERHYFSPKQKGKMPVVSDTEDSEDSSENVPTTRTQILNDALLQKMVCMSAELLARDENESSDDGWTHHEIGRLIKGYLSYGPEKWTYIRHDFDFGGKSAAQLKQKFYELFPEANDTTVLGQREARRLRPVVEIRMRPGSSHGRKYLRRIPFTEEEDNIILRGVEQFGASWSRIAKLPGLEKRIGTDIRDRLRNRFPDIYTSLGFKLSKKKRERPPREAPPERQPAPQTTHIGNESSGATLTEQPLPTHSTPISPRAGTRVALRPSFGNSTRDSETLIAGSTEQSGTNTQSSAPLLTTTATQEEMASPHVEDEHAADQVHPTQEEEEIEDDNAAAFQSYVNFYSERPASSTQTSTPSLQDTHETNTPIEETHSVLSIPSDHTDDLSSDDTSPEPEVIIDNEAMYDEMPSFSSEATPVEDEKHESSVHNEDSDVAPHLASDVQYNSVFSYTQEVISDTTQVIPSELVDGVTPPHPSEEEEKEEAEAEEEEEKEEEEEEEEQQSEDETAVLKEEEFTPVEPSIASPPSVDSDVALSAEQLATTTTAPETEVLSQIFDFAPPLPEPDPIVHDLLTRTSSPNRDIVSERPFDVSHFFDRSGISDIEEPSTIAPTLHTSRQHIEYPTMLSHTLGSMKRAWFSDGEEDDDEPTTDTESDTYDTSRYKRARTSQLTDFSRSFSRPPIRDVIGARFTRHGELQYKVHYRSSWEPADVVAREESERVADFVRVIGASTPVQRSLLR